LWSGEIRPFGGLRYVATPVSGTSTQTIYRYVNAGAEYWFAWEGDISIVEASVDNDALNRRFYTGDGLPKKTGNDIGIPAGVDAVLPARWYYLGVKLPYQVPTIGNQVGGSGNQETLVYVFTHVTGWGEESGPSEPSADFTAFVNRTSVDFTRPTPSFTFVDGDVSVANNTIAETAWEDDAAGKINAYARVRLTTSGALPTGLSTGTDYWVIPIDDDHFSLATSFANALAGTAVDITAAAGGGTHTITQFQPDARYNITDINIYRTNTGTEGAEFLFVATLDIQTGTTVVVTDNIADSALGTAIDSTDYDVPPDDMIGLGRLPNGMLFGISPDTKQVCFSVPFVPHAWPDNSDYRRTMHYTPRACGAVGTTVVVATDGKPYTFTGVGPGEITGSALDAEQAILNGKSLVETPSGVVWASPDGLYMVGPGVSNIITRQLLSKDEWLALNPSSMVCGVYDARIYIAFDADSTGIYEVAIFDPQEPAAAFITLDQSTRVLYPDVLSDALYMVIDGQIQQWDADALNPLTWTYRTGIRRDPFPNNKSVAQIISDFGGGVLSNGQTLANYNVARNFIIGYNADITTYDATGQNSAYDPILGAPGMSALGETALGGDMFFDTPPAIDRTLTFRLFSGDGVLRYTTTVSSTDLFRLPPGYRDAEWAIEVSANCRMSIVGIGNSPRELGRVP
jgi:hypothetical protein